MDENTGPPCKRCAEKNLVSTGASIQIKQTSLIPLTRHIGIGLRVEQKYSNSDQ